jgi:hypothetical protein
MKGQNINTAFVPADSRASQQEETTLFRRDIF